MLLSPLGANIQFELLVKVLLISYGDVDLPTKSEDLESCLRSLACKEPLPEWVFQLAATLAEDETYVSMTKKMRK